MNRTASTKRMIGPKIAWAVTTAMASTLLAGCATSAAPPAAVSASMAEEALGKGKHERAISHAEAAVLAEPHNAEFRVTLASAYLDAGRFASAAQSYDDAMKLGDNSPRTALSRALALTGQGAFQDAAAVLNSRDDIAVADLGLALALAGQADRGIYLMGNAIRAGENTAKIRQNLAYAYALAGRWREARLMASQDVPADKVGDRMEQWAQMAQPEAWQYRVAALLDVPAGVHDEGQPVQLALANNPSIDQLVEEAAQFATADVPAPAPVAAEIPALAAPADVAPAAYEAPQAEERAVEFTSAFATAAPAPEALSTVSQDAASFVQTAAVESLSRPALVPAADRGEGTHLVQLGSFSSEAGAKRAWSIYTKKYPELAGHEMVITEAVVRGKHYWRVSAAGFGRSSSSSMCGKVRSSGGGCIAYAQGRPLPGAVDTGVRLASR